MLPLNRRGASWASIWKAMGPQAYRIHWRTPSFANLQVLKLLAKGHLVADLVALIGTIDIVLGDIDR